MNYESGFVKGPLYLDRDPVHDLEATTKKYVDSSISEIPLSVTLQSATPGTSQTGHFNISGTGKLGALSVSGLSALGDISVSNFIAIGTVTLATDPLLPLEAATKGYVDLGLAAKENLLGFVPEDSANKSQINGYASLDGTGVVPLSELPPGFGVTATWGGIIGILSDQGDLQAELDNKQDYFGYGVSTDYLDGDNIWQDFNTSARNAVSGTSPINYNSGTGAISIQVANTGQNGYLSSTDWNTFNNKQNALGFTPLNPANNLSELTNMATARTNLGLTAGGAGDIWVEKAGDTMTGKLGIGAAPTGNNYFYAYSTTSDAGIKLESNFAGGSGYITLTAQTTSYNFTGDATRFQLYSFKTVGGVGFASEVDNFRFSIGSNSALGQLGVYIQNDAYKGIVVRGFSPTQSGNLFEAQLSTSVIAARIDNIGRGFFTGRINIDDAPGAVESANYRLNNLTVVSASGSALLFGTTSNTMRLYGSSHEFYTGSTLTSTRTTAGNFTLSPIVSTSGSPTHFLLTGAAHTTLAASTEAIDVNFNLARTVQFATGAKTTQRAFLLQAPTYGFVGASTITTATTFEISGPPVAGTNATITNAYALNIASGNSAFNGRIGMAINDSLPAIYSLSNTTTGLSIFSTNTLALSISGSATFQVSGSAVTSVVKLQVAHGSASDPGLQGRTDTNTGLFWTGSDVLGIALNGAERARFDATGLGIGITPTATLHVVSASAVDVFKVVGFSTSRSVTIDRFGSVIAQLGPTLANTNPSATVPVYTFTSDNTTGIGLHTTNTVAIISNSTNVANFTSTQRLGIGGATTPQAVLDLGALALSKITGGPQVALFRNYLNLSARGDFAAVDFEYPGGGVFRAGEVGVAGTNDIFFQAVPFTSAGFGYLEAYLAAGMIIGTGGNTSPIIIRPNRSEIARFTTTGLAILTTANSASPLQVRATPTDIGSFVLNNAVFFKSPTSNGGSSPAAAEPVLILGREGVFGQAYANFVEFDIKRYENSGVSSRTQLDIRMTHGANEANGTLVQSLKSDGTTTFAGPILLASSTDAAAPNSSMYYSTTQSKPVWKDAAGVVNNLY